MFLLKKKHVLQILENLLYLALLGLGIYFIYMGDVIPRFWLGRTISTYIQNVPENFTMGKDFNLSFGGEILKLGIMTFKVCT